jgi:hypothetical protein
MHVLEMLITYSLATCFDRRRRHHHQGNIQYYSKPKETVKMLKLTAHCYKLRHVRLPVRVEQLRCHWKFFHEILYLRTSLKSVEKIQVSLKSDKNNG